MVKKAETEKITINLNPITLGYIDLLVENGRYSNRTEFIKDAIEKNLSLNQKIIESNTPEATQGLGYFTTIGVHKIDNEMIQEKLQAGEKIHVWTLGMLVVKKDVAPQDFINVVEQIKVYGVFKGPAEIKKYYNL